MYHYISHNTNKHVMSMPTKGWDYLSHRRMCTVPSSSSALRKSFSLAAAASRSLCRSPGAAVQERDRRGGCGGEEGTHSEPHLPTTSVLTSITICGLLPVAQNIGTFLRWEDVSLSEEGKTVVRDFSSFTSSSLFLFSSSSSSCTEGVLLLELPIEPDLLFLAVLLPGDTEAGLGVTSSCSESPSDSYSMSGMNTFDRETTERRDGEGWGRLVVGRRARFVACETVESSFFLFLCELNCGRGEGAMISTTSLGLGGQRMRVKLQ